MKRRPVRWSAEAVRNLLEIVDRISDDSPSRAREFAERLLRSATRLGAFPHSGRKLPELEDHSPQPREIIVGEYRLIYRLGDRVVDIVMVIQGRRLLPLKN